jgi:hypothetical protein
MPAGLASLREKPDNQTGYQDKKIIPGLAVLQPLVYFHGVRRL